MPKPNILEAEFSMLTVDQQADALQHLANLHDVARTKLMSNLKDELVRLAAGDKRLQNIKRLASGTKTVTRIKPSAKYRSKKDKSLVWSGRGSLPRWMREEMKIGKLKREAFLIAKKK